jgi:hypothetical protein
VIARLQAGHALTHFNHDTATFVAEHRRENAFRIVPDSVNASVWHTPVWVILISTSPFFGGATSISTIFNGWPGPNATAARDFI